MGRRRKKNRKRAAGKRSTTPKVAARDEDTPQSLADRYVAELADGHTTRAPASFTLDRAVAEKKLREFQLPDPSYYIALVVQAAVCQGAKRIDVTTHGDRLHLEYAAPPLGMDDLEQLYDTALGGRDPSNPERQDLRRALGLAISVARGLSRRLELVSREGAEGVRLVAQPNTSDTCESFRQNAAGQPTRTHLMIDHQPEWDPDQHEVPTLRRLCHYADVDILLNGKSISHGLVLPGALAKAPIRHKQSRGEVGFEPLRGGPAELRIIRHGVLIAEHALPGADGRLVAVVDNEHLKTDLSGFDVVRDDAYASLVRAVRRAEDKAQRRHRVDRLCEQHVASEAERVVSLLARRRKSGRRRYFGLVATGILVFLSSGGYLFATLRWGEITWFPVALFLVLAGGLVAGSTSGIMDSLRERLVQRPLTERSLALMPPSSPLWEHVFEQVRNNGPSGLGKALRRARDRHTTIDSEDTAPG